MSSGPNAVSCETTLACDYRIPRVACVLWIGSFVYQKVRRLYIAGIVGICRDWQDSKNPPNRNTYYGPSGLIIASYHKLHQHDHGNHRPLPLNYVEQCRSFGQAGGFFRRPSVCCMDGEGSASGVSITSGCMSLRLGSVRRGRSLDGGIPDGEVKAYPKCASSFLHPLQPPLVLLEFPH